MEKRHFAEIIRKRRHHQWRFDDVISERLLKWQMYMRYFHVYFRLIAVHSYWNRSRF